MTREGDGIDMADAEDGRSAHRDDATPSADPPRAPEVPTFLLTACARVQEAAPAPPSPLAETSKMDLSAVAVAVDRGRLPFMSPQPSRPLGVAAGRQDLRGTADPDMRAIIATLARGPLPFARPEQQRPAGDPEAREDADFALLPLETYASVTGALARGEPREATLARHKVSVETFERLARAWARRLQGEPHLLARFRQLAKGGA